MSFLSLYEGFSDYSTVISETGNQGLLSLPLVDIYVNMHIPFLLGMNHFGDSDGLDEPISFFA